MVYKNQLIPGGTTLYYMSAKHYIGYKDYKLIYANMVSKH